MQRSDDPKQVSAVVDTPRSVVVLPAEVIAQTGSTSPEDALRTASGFTFGAAAVQLIAVYHNLLRRWADA